MSCDKHPSSSCRGNAVIDPTGNVTPDTDTSPSQSQQQPPPPSLTTTEHILPRVDNNYIVVESPCDVIQQI